MAEQQTQSVDYSGLGGKPVGEAQQAEPTSDNVDYSGLGGKPVGDAPAAAAPKYPRYTPPASAQPGFLDRAYQTSGIKGLIESSKARAQQNTEVQTAAMKALKSHDYGTAADLILRHLARTAAGPAGEIISAVAGSSMEHGKAAVQAGKQGKSGEATIQAAEAVPVVGPIAGSIGEPLGEDARKVWDSGGSEGKGALLGDVVGGAAQLGTMLLGGRAASGAEGAEAAEASEGAAAAAPKVEAAAAPAVEAKAAGSPVQAAIKNAVNKSGIAEGSEAAVAPKVEDIQPHFQQALRNTIKQVAKDNGVEIKGEGSIRDLGREAGDAVKSVAKSEYAQLDEATGGRFQRFDKAIENINNKINELTGIDDEKVEALTQKKDELLESMEQTFEEAKAKGVDPAIAESARKNYRTSQALYDVDSNVKMSTSGSRPGIGDGSNPEIVNPDKFHTRMNRLYDRGRLQQAMGEDAANDILSHADAAQVAAREIKEFVPSSPTGKHALQELITKSEPTVKSKLTKLGKGEGVIDWSKVRNQFENMTSKEQAEKFGAETDKLRTYLDRQALKQSMKKWLKRGAGALGGGYLFHEGVKAAL